MNSIFLSFFFLSLRVAVQGHARAWRLCLRIFFLPFCLIAASCSDNAAPVPVPTAMPFAGQSVRLLVVDDQGIAKAVRGLAGEWTARTGASLEVRETTLAELPAAWADQCEAIIYSSHELGHLAANLEPLPEELLRQGATDWNEVLPLLRKREAMWDSQTLAVPLGLPLLALYYRKDWFAQLHLQPPQTWDDYQRLVDLFRTPDVLASLQLSEMKDFRPTAEPLADGWAGLTMLARGAAYAKHPDYYSSLFHVETMEPRLAEPPFERALTELIAANGSSQSRFTMEDVWQTLRDGRCAMAIAWPIGQESGTRGQGSGVRGQESGVRRVPGTPGEESSSTTSVALAVASLPGSKEVFHPEKKIYVPRQTETVPLFTGVGRLGSAVRAKANADPKRKQAAMQLLVAITDARWGSVVSAASPSTAPFRASQFSAPLPWGRSQEPELARDYAGILRSNLESPDCLMAIRIPGRVKYLDALDKAVADSLAGTRSAKEALEETAQKWREITSEIGLSAQQKAYRASELRLF